MRLGGPVDTPDPDRWIASLRASGYRAACCPVTPGADSSLIRDYAAAAARADIVIAEVGAWGNNPLSADPAVRSESIRRTQEALTLADEIGARCCVNVSGSCGEKWDGIHPHNLDPDTFDLIVESVRAILDGANPRRADYTLEPMSYTLPDSPQSYRRLIEAVDRPRFAVHLDPVNMVNSPERCYHNAQLIRDCFEQLGPWIRAVHVKDIRLDDRMTVHLEEVRLGLGMLDLPTLLREMSRLDPNTPFMLEHLPTAEDYRLAAAHLRSVAGSLGIDL